MELNQFEIQCGENQIHLLKYGNFNFEDYLNQLTNLELERFYSFSNEKRKREFVATRILRHTLFGHQHIHYNEVGAPFIKNEGFISISHTDNIVGIAINQFFQIGFDIEKERKSILNIASKFINEEEEKIFDIYSSKEITKCWSAKESLYKLANRKEIDFKKDLILTKINSELFRGQIFNSNEILTTEIGIFDFENKFISINTIACAEKK
ncbi:MAG: 4'-phosphopantetheinyl transferase superfamily protein [Flavobacteriia bacterium]|nr:4'-phosphopantetheinyl transferase superfamily protein [Flavobacteriia bacterium]